MINELCAKEPTITNSIKLQHFTTARMIMDDDLVEIIVSGAEEGI